MAGLITYNSYHFVDPNPITDIKYQELKEILKTNVHFPISSNDEGFFRKFKNYIGAICLGVIGATTIYIIEKIFWNGKDRLEWLSLIFGLIIIIAFFKLCLEGASYNNYVNQKYSYFLKMKYSILKSKDLNEYNSLFYDNRSKSLRKAFNKWKREYKN